MAVAVFESPRVVISAVFTLLACTLAPSIAAEALVAALAALALFALAFAVAHVATREIPVREGEWLELGDRGRGQVRAVRSWFTVVVTLDGATLLVPNHRIQRIRSEATH